MGCKWTRIIGIASTDPEALMKIAPYKGMAVVAPSKLPAGSVEAIKSLMYDPEYTAEWNIQFSPYKAGGGASIPQSTSLDYFMDPSGYFYAVATHTMDSFTTEETGDVTEIYMLDCSTAAPGRQVSIPMVIIGVVGIGALGYLLLRKK